MAAIVATGALAGVAAVVAAGVVNIMGGSLPDPANLEALTFAQPTIVYDRTGKIELARFEREKRRVVTFADVPHLVLDATTTAEDRTFWDNDGFDLAAIAAAVFQNASGDGDVERGASTITQQLVRARLLPEEVIDGNDRYLRKALEIVQAGRLTSAFPGEEGKQKIMAAYLNEIYYGHEAYGIAAAAEIYFGVSDLSKLTPAQAALLAGLPKAPSTYDPYRYAVKDAEGKLVVPSTSPPVVRRDYILRGLGTSRWTALTPSELEAALDEPVVLSGVKPRTMLAPHFAWAVRGELEKLLGGADAVETGGYKVITTLDWGAQQLAEKYLLGAAIVPNLSKEKGDALLTRMHFSKADRAWIRDLRGKDVHNGALVALDYRHGDVLAYVGSAGYYRDDMASAEFAPQHDAAGAFRQPGSAFKAVVYATAFDEQALTPGSLLLDIRTDFGGGWEPGDYDGRERGPVLARTAIQQSLNLPAIRAYERVGSEAVAAVAERLGLQFPGGPDLLLQAGLSAAIGTVETRPIDLTSAFGALGNGGVHVPSRMILSIAGPGGAEVYHAADPKGKAAVSPQAAFLMSDVLAGNTDPDQNEFWAATLSLRNGPDGERRPAAAKTGTADEWRDFSTYGYLPAPKDPDAPAIAVGVWMGNSDHSITDGRPHAMSLDTAGEVWHSFLRDYTQGWPVAQFARPENVVQAKIDRWSGGAPGPWTHGTVEEWFIKGTQPDGKHPVDERGLLYTEACGSWMVDPVKAELGPDRWLDDVAAWVRRALSGRTAYSGGAGRLIGPCVAPGGGGGGHGHGHGHGNDPTPPPILEPTALPMLEPTNTPQP